VANNNQTDSDGDGFGDACDICPGFDDNADQDSDGVPDGCDNCPALANSGQEDNDGDSDGDVCDSDDDDDGILDDGDGSGTIGDNPCTAGATTDCDDNCQFDVNPDQEDDNINGIGNECEGCCLGELVGDINCSGNDIPDISDITRFINDLYLKPQPFCCDQEADLDHDGKYNIVDLVWIIDYLYVSHRPLLNCP